MTIKTYSKWIRVISMLLVFVMVLGVMPMFNQLEAVNNDAKAKLLAKAPNILNFSRLKETFEATKAEIHPDKQDFVWAALCYYISSADSNYRIARNIAKINQDWTDKTVDLPGNAIFFFDGCSVNVEVSESGTLVNNKPITADDAETWRCNRSAVCIVVQTDEDGYPVIVFATKNASTIPDNVRACKLNDNNHVPTLKDGVYSIITTNHGKDNPYASIKVNSANVIRCGNKDDTGDTSYESSSTGINIHARGNTFIRGTKDSLMTDKNRTRSSTGCLNVGYDYWDTDNIYNDFIKTVTTFEPEYSSGNGKTYKTGKDVGVVIVNRSQFTKELEEIYGADTKHTAEEIVEMLTEQSPDIQVNGNNVVALPTINFISPSNNATLPLTNAGISLSWTAIANADSYHLAVRDITNSTVQNGPADAYYRLPGNKTAYTLKNLENNGVNNGMLQDGHTYRLWICAYDANENAVSAARELVITVERKMDTQTWWQDYNPTIDSRITADLIQKYLNTKPNSILNHVCMVNGEMMLKVDGEYFNLGFDNYFSVSNSLVNNNLKDESIARTLTPAQIIYEACMENETNVAYILATLDKEQGLLSAWQNTYGANQQVRLNLATGYKANKVKYEGFIGQIIGTTYVTYKNAKANKSFAETYEQYTPSSDPTNASFNYFIEQYYNKVAAWFDAELGITDDMGGVSRDVVLILDGSGSMSSREFNETKQAALLFAEEVLNDNTNTNIAIMAFGNNNYLFKKNANDSGFYNTVEDIEAVLSKGRQPGGATYMADALLYADALLETRVSDRKVIMLMSDGEANGYTSHAAQYGTSGSWGDSDANVTYNVANALTKNKNYYIYTLGFGLYENSRAEKLLKGIADLRSECTYQKVDKVEDLRFGFEENADNIVLLENQILITIACPVEVYVRYNGEMLSSDPAYLSTATSFGTLSISEDGETKTLKLLGEYDYDINIYGTDEGTMTVTVKYPGKAQEVVEFKDVPVTSYMSTKFNTDNSQPIVMYYASGEDSYEEVIVPNQQYNGETSFDVTYIVDGVIFANETYHIGEIITPSVVPEKEGYIFAGWSGMPKQMPATNIVLEAEWTKQSPTDIIFDYWTMMMIVLRNKK